MTRLIDADALYNGTMKDEYFRFKETDKTGREAFAYSCAMERLVEAPTVGGWMSVDDKLPAVGAQCLVVHEPVYLNETDVTICRKIMISAYMECGKEHFFIDLRSPLFPVPVVLNKVTHWMLLPELPKEED